VICDAKERERIQARERYAKRVAEGLCTSCGAERKPGCTMCPRCLARKAARQARRVMRLGELGVDRHAPIRCEVCLREKPVVPGGMCGKCCEDLALAQLGEQNAWRQKDVDESLRPRLRPQHRRQYDEIAGGSQKLFRFAGNVVDGAKDEPYELPEYSRKVFADSIRWEG